MFKRIFTLLLAVSMLAASSISASAVENCQMFQNGTVQLICDQDKIAVITDEPELNNMPASINEISPEHRISKVTVYIPDSSEYYKEIYDFLSTALQSDSHATITGDDKNHCATFTMEVQYDRIEADDRYIYFDLTKVSGGFSDKGTVGSDVGENVQVWEQWIEVAQTGSNLYDKQFIKSQLDQYTISPSNRNWTYYPPSDWIPVSDAGFGAIVSVKYNFGLGRGSSSWESDPLQITLLNTTN